MIRAQVSDGGRVYVEVEDEGSSREGTFGEIESPHGLYLLRSLSAECGTRPGARGWGTRVLFSAGHDLGISLETALVTARQALTSAAERAKPPGYYSEARTDIINAHADLVGCAGHADQGGWAGRRNAGCGMRDSPPGRNQG